MKTFLEYIGENWAWRAGPGEMAALVKHLAKNPIVPTIKSQLDKSEFGKLRYMKVHKDLYTWDAGKSTHGTMADSLGLSKDQWRNNTLTGFIHSKDIPKIGSNRKSFRHWLAQRHLEAKHRVARGHPGRVGVHVSSTDDTTSDTTKGRYLTRRYVGDDDDPNA